MTWKYTYEHDTNAASEALWDVISNVEGWPSIDPNIQSLEMTESPGVGARFTLKPKGGPRIRFQITQFQPPSTNADTSRLHGSVMTTTHKLQTTTSGTLIAVDIQISGILAPLWSILVGRKHATGLPEQTRRLIAAASHVEP